MELRKFIKTTIREYLNENTTSINNIDFNSFPKDVLKTLKDEYGHYYLHNFDWNSKQDEFVKNGVYDGKGFRNWLIDNEKEEFVKNLDKIITATRRDLITITKKKNANKALKDFEELIIPAIGKENLITPISKYLETALLVIGSTNTDISYINRELSKAFKEAESIIDNDGSLNYSKITPSKIFTGDGINLPKFKDFVSKNPEYKDVFNDWKKIFDKSIELSSIELNAFRNSTPYEEIRNLYDYLIELRDKNKTKRL